MKYFAVILLICIIIPCKSYSGIYNNYAFFSFGLSYLLSEESTLSLWEEKISNKDEIDNANENNETPPPAEYEIKKTVSKYSHASSALLDYGLGYYLDYYSLSLSLHMFYRTLSFSDVGGDAVKPSERQARHNILSMYSEFNKDLLFITDDVSIYALVDLGFISVQYGDTITDNDIELLYGLGTGVRIRFDAVDVLLGYALKSNLADRDPRISDSSVEHKVQYLVHGLSFNLRYKIPY